MSYPRRKGYFIHQAGISIVKAFFEMLLYPKEIHEFLDVEDVEHWKTWQESEKIWKSSWTKLGTEAQQNLGSRARQSKKHHEYKCLRVTIIIEVVFWNLGGSELEKERHICTRFRFCSDAEFACRYFEENRSMHGSLSFIGNGNGWKHTSNLGGKAPFAFVKIHYLRVKYPSVNNARESRKGMLKFSGVK